MFPGRIWADFTFLNKERTALLPKEPEFSKWYDTIARWVKKHSERVVWTDPIRRKTSVIGYAGVGAQKFYDSGGRLAISAQVLSLSTKSFSEESSITRLNPTEPTFKILFDEGLLHPPTELS